MENATTTKAQPTDAGCWIDGHWGQYGPSRLVEIAVENGMKLTYAEARALYAYQQGTETFRADDVLGGASATENAADWLLESGGMADRAEEWLNEHIAPEGFLFHWDDGEFFLSLILDLEDDET